MYFSMYNLYMVCILYSRYTYIDQIPITKIYGYKVLKSLMYTSYV